MGKLHTGPLTNGVVERHADFVRVQVLKEGAIDRVRIVTHVYCAAIKSSQI